jgi:phage-related protein
MSRDLEIRITGDNTSARAALTQTEQAVQGVTQSASTMGAATDRAVATAVEGATKAQGPIGRVFSSLSQGVKTVSPIVLGFAGGAIGGVLSEAVERAGEFAKHFLESANEIADLSDKLRVSTGTVQEWQFAISQAGGSMPALVTSIGFLKKAVAKGSDGVQDDISALGLSFDTIRQMDTATLFTTIADAVGQIQDPMEQARIGADLMGSGFGANLAAMQEGFGKLGKQAEDAGAVMSEKSVRAADNFGDSLSKLKDVGLNLLSSVLGPFVPDLTNLVGALAAVLEPAGKLLSLALQPIAAALEIVSGWISGLIGYFTNITEPIGAASGAIGTFWDWLANKLQPVLDPVVGLMKDIWDAFDAFARLVYAINTRVVEAVIQMVSTVILWIVDKLKPIFAPFEPLLDGIVTVFVALKDGAILAARLLYEGVKTWLIDRFVGIVDGAREKIQAVTGFFRDMYDKVVGHSYVPDMVDAIGSHFSRLPDLMQNPAKAATSTVEGMFDAMMGAISQKVGGWLGSLASTVSNTLGSLVSGGDWQKALTNGLTTFGGSLMQSYVGMFVNAWKENGFRGFEDTWTPPPGYEPAGPTGYTETGQIDPTGQYAYQLRGSMTDAEWENYLANLGFRSGATPMATGGYVPPRPGGTIARLAEAGEGEFVVPASKMGGVTVNLTINTGASVVDDTSMRRFADALLPQFAYALQRARLA